MNGLTAQHNGNLSTKSWDNLNFFNCNLMLGAMLKSCQGLMWHFTSHLSIDTFYSFPNHLYRGCSDECLPWSRKAKSELHKKYCYVAHAEVNAILNKCSADVRGATIYVALFPCNECAKVIIQSKIREVVYLNDNYHDTDSCRASRIMFEMAGVKTRQFRPETRAIEVDL